MDRRDGVLEKRKTAFIDHQSPGRGHREVSSNINQDLVSHDIERYINSILDGEDSIEQWGDEMKTNIKNTVLKSAEGMYALF